MLEDSETGEESTDESTTPDAADSLASEETAESPSKEVTVSDSVVSGNVHTGDVHHHYTATDSQETSNTSATFGPPSTSSSSPGEGFVAPVMVGAVGTQMAQPQPYGQVLMVGPPSGAAKIIGIFIIIWGAIGLLDGFSFFTMPMTATFIGLTLFSLGISGAFIYAGMKVYSYKKWGIQLTWILLVLGLIASIASVMMLPDMFAQMVEDGDVSQEEVDVLESQGGLVTGIGIGISVFCGGICALMVAIPLMVANNGLDGSSLFSRSPTLVATGNSEDN